MASRKRNEFLDIEESDAEQSDNGYDSEAAEESKTRASKRRKVLDIDARFAARFEDDDEDEEEQDDDAQDVKGDEEEEYDENDNQDESEKLDSTQGDPANKQVTTTAAKTKAKAKPRKKDKSGVVYLSSLPPYLKPAALKTMLTQRGFGPITRVFLTPTVRSTSGSGRRSNRRKTYSDGWVEFASKKTAKIAAETLCACPIGGKRGFYHDDLWNMKYLKGFKWADLMETVNRERSEREARQRIEDARARKEDKVFLSGVEKGKVVEGIRKKREGKQKKNTKSDDGDGDAAPDNLQIRRVFRQNEVKQQKTEGQDLGSIGEDAKRVLGKIF